MVNDCHPGSDMKRFLWEGKFDALSAAWQSPDLQSDIAALAWAIERTRTARAMIAYWRDRFESACEVERANIVLALTRIGINNLQSETSAIRALLDIRISCPEHQRAALSAIKYIEQTIGHQKEACQLSRQTVPQEISGNLATILAETLPIAEDENARQDIRALALRGLHQHGDSRERQRIITLLSEVSQGGDRCLRSIASDELFGILGPKDQLTIESLKREVTEIAPDQATNQELIRLVVMIGMSGHPDFLPFLYQLKNVEKCRDDYRTNNYINLAIRAVEGAG